MLGPSGCGKTTLLRCLSGLEPARGGSITIQGENITGLAPERRRLGLVFQQPALFPHMDVGRNVAYGLMVAEAARQSLPERLAGLGRGLCRGVLAALRPRRCQPPERDHGRRVGELLEMVGLAGYERRKVDTLSGGEAQRVALARALAPDPRVLLLDEPLSLVDHNARLELQAVLKRLHTELDLTVLHVTHDREEARALGDQAAVMQQGAVIQQGAWGEVHAAPANAFVSEFLGLG